MDCFFIFSYSQKQKKKSNKCKTRVYPLLSRPFGSLLLLGTLIFLLFIQKMKKTFPTYCVLRFHLSLLPSSHIFNTQCPTSPICSAGIFVLLFCDENIFDTLSPCSHWFWCIMKEEASPVQCMTPALSCWHNWIRAEHSEWVPVPSLHEFQVWCCCSFAQNLLSDNDFASLRFGHHVMGYLYKL